MSTLLSRRIDDSFYIITFDYPSKLNCFTIEDYARLGQMLLEADAHPDVLFTVLQAKGHYFSSGIDVGTLDAKARMLGNSDLGGIVTDMTSRMEFVTRCFINHSKVLVACLNGPAIGLTAAMVMHCDFVYSIDDKVYLDFPFSKLGLGAEGCLSVTLSDKLPVNLTKEALLLGNPIGYEHLKDRVITRNYNMVDAEIFNAAVLRDLKSDISSCNPKSILVIKELTSKIKRSLYNEVIGNEGYAAVGLISKGTVVESLVKYRSLISSKRGAKL